MTTMDRVSSADRQLVESLVTYGCEEIPVRISHLLSGCVRRFTHFLEEPKEYREKWNFWTVGEAGKDLTDDGYIEKGDKPGEDAKHVLHWSKKLLFLLQQRDVDLRPHLDLLHYCETIDNICWREYCHWMEVLDHVVPGYHFYERLREPRARERSLLRLISYKDVPGKKEIGKPHFDKNALTFHLGELLPGLRVAQARELYVNSPDRPLIFFGKKIEKITNGELKALFHAVTDERMPGDTRRRWCAVWFGHMDVTLDEEG